MAENQEPDEVPRDHYRLVRRGNDVQVGLREDGILEVHAPRSSLTFERPCFNVMLISLTGDADPRMKMLFFTLLSTQLLYEPRQKSRLEKPRGLRLFVDARKVTHNGLMFDAWIHFLTHNREHLHRLHVLTSNKAVALSVQIIQHLSGTGSLIQLYDDEKQFESVRHGMMPSLHGKTRFYHKRLRHHLQTTCNRLKLNT